MALKAQSDKQIILTLCNALYDFDPNKVQELLSEIIHPDALCRYFHPIGDVKPERLYSKLYAPLYTALPDFERREIICIAGSDDDGTSWVGNAGYFIGTFTHAFMDIPPTGHIAHIRFHEFYKFKAGVISEIQAVWDIPSLMMQAGVWPMGPSLGYEWLVPAPARQDGLDNSRSDKTHPLKNKTLENKALENKILVLDMLTAMSKHPKYGGAQIMQLEKFWHPKFCWYGPSGIGSSRGISGFRNHHQIPFLKAMPDRGQHSEDTTHHFFAEGQYVAVTGWPNMSQTLTDDGWLGIAPTNQKINLRSLDFWRIENQKIRENWVMIDLLDIWSQIGVDVLSRMRQLALPKSQPSQTASGIDANVG